MYNKTQSKMRQELLQAKIRLYILLMQLDVATITDNEVDIMDLLSKDEQIQFIMNREKTKTQSR